MKHGKTLTMAAAMVAWASAALAQHPGDGWERDNIGFYVQNRTDAAMAERYTFADSVHNFQLFRGEERVEMRWDTWENQGIEHLWQSDVMFEKGTQQTCIMQVKSNTNGESVYLQVFDGNLHPGSKNTEPLLRDHYGKWFHLRVAYHPKTRVGRVWINGSLALTRTHPNASSDWYFKNGTYGTLDHSKSHYRNPTLWKKTGVVGLADAGRRQTHFIPDARSGASPAVGAGAHPSARARNLVMVEWNGVFGLTGRAISPGRPGLRITGTTHRP